MLNKINQHHKIFSLNSKNPLFLPIFGLLKNCKDVELFCDENESSLALSAGRLCCLAGENFDFFKEFCDSRTAETAFCGVSEEIFNFLKSNYEILWTSCCRLFVYNGKSLEGVSGERLKPMDAKFWQRVSDGTFYHAEKDEILECLTNRKSSAIYVDGQPVCWCLLHIENSLGMLYTLPEFRRQGLALLVMKDLTQKMLNDGETPYAFIVDGNDASASLAAQYNLEPVCRANWCGLSSRNVLPQKTRRKNILCP